MLCSYMCTTVDLFVKNLSPLTCIVCYTTILHEIFYPLQRPRTECHMCTRRLPRLAHCLRCPRRLRHFLPELKSGRSADGAGR